MSSLCNPFGLPILLLSKEEHWDWCMERSVWVSSEMEVGGGCSSVQLAHGFQQVFSATPSKVFQLNPRRLQITQNNPWSTMVAARQTFMRSIGARPFVAIHALESDVIVYSKHLQSANSPAANYLMIQRQTPNSKRAQEKWQWWKLQLHLAQGTDHPGVENRLPSREDTGEEMENTSQKSMTPYSPPPKYHMGVKSGVEDDFAGWFLKATGFLCLRWGGDWKTRMVCFKGPLRIGPPKTLAAWLRDYKVCLHQGWTGSEH